MLTNAPVSPEARLDRAEVDVAHHAAGVRTTTKELNKAVVLQDRERASRVRSR